MILDGAGGETGGREGHRLGAREILVGGGEAGRSNLLAHHLQRSPVGLKPAEQLVLCSGSGPNPAGPAAVAELILAWDVCRLFSRPTIRERETLSLSLWCAVLTTSYDGA